MVVFFFPLSESSDDSGIVNYMWEQVDGPLWHSDGPLNTPVLALQNISPGDYTFRCKVHIPLKIHPYQFSLLDGSGHFREKYFLKW